MDQIVYNTHTQTCSTCPTLGGEKRFENFINIGLTHTPSIVSVANNNTVIGNLNADIDISSLHTLKSVNQSIYDQVGKNLHKRTGVGVQNQVISAINIDLVLSPLVFGTQAEQNFVYIFTEIDGSLLT